MPPRKTVTRPPEDPEIVPADSDVEVWKNVTAGTVYLNRIGDYGKQVSELVHGGRTFTITPTERRINQGACALADMDVFTNGTLQPKSLLDDEPDSDKLLHNPNLFDDKDIPDLFKLKGENFTARIAAVTNPASIDRLIEAAREPRRNVVVQQYETLLERKRALEGDIERKTFDQPVAASGAGMPRAVTPK